MWNLTHEAHLEDILDSEDGGASYAKPLSPMDKKNMEKKVEKIKNI